MNMNNEEINEFKIYWQDLNSDCQQRLFEFLGDNGNYDVYPIVTIERLEEEQ